MKASEFEVLHLLATKRGIDSDIFFTFWAKWQSRDVKKRTHQPIGRPSSIEQLVEMKDKLLTAEQQPIQFTYQTQRITPLQVRVAPEVPPAEQNLKYIRVNGQLVPLRNQSVCLNGFRGEYTENGTAYYTQIARFNDPYINAFRSFNHGQDYTLEEFYEIMQQITDDAAREHDGNYTYDDHTADESEVEYFISEVERQDIIADAFLAGLLEEEEEDNEDETVLVVDTPIADIVYTNAAREGVVDPLNGTVTTGETDDEWIDRTGREIAAEVAEVLGE